MRTRDRAIARRRLPDGTIKAVKSIVKAIEELRRDIRDGTCVMCEEPLPPRRTGRPRLICNEYECERAYQRMWRAQRREAESGSLFSEVGK
jgi:hypothetical protein